MLFFNNEMSFYRFNITVMLHTGNKYRILSNNVIIK